MTIKQIFKRTKKADEITNENLIAQKSKLVDALNKISVDDEAYEATLDAIERVDNLIMKKEKRHFKWDSMIISTCITTGGLVLVSLLGMKYEDDGNIIQHTASKNAMNKLGR